MAREDAVPAILREVIGPARRGRPANSEHLGSPNLDTDPLLMLDKSPQLLKFIGHIAQILDEVSSPC